MKVLIASTILFLIGSTSFAQSVPKIEAQAFWDTNIQSIMNVDIDAMVEETQFPLASYDGEWDEEMFREQIEYLFDETSTEVLSGQTYRDIEVIDDDPKNIVYRVVIPSMVEYEGETFESTTFLSFMKFDGKWKLFSIEIAG